MVKAKKPASTAAAAAGKTGDEATKNTGSMPKTARSKPSIGSTASKAATKQPLPEKTATQTVSKASPEPAKTPAPEPKGSPAAGLEKAVNKPSDSKPTEKPAPEGSKSSPPARAEGKPAPVVTTEPEAEKSGSVFWPLLIGGGLAAALGFLASEMNMLGTRGDTGDLRALLSEQQAQIAELQSAEPMVPEIEFPELDGLTSEVASLSEALGALDARLTEVEKRPITGGSSEAAVAAYERELAALQASVEEQRSEIEGLLNNALSVEEATAEAARSATLQAALTRITAAINGGKPYASALADLQANGLDDVPAALADNADNGVVTLINLQTRFPDAARAALSTARASGNDEDTGGVGSFLRRQLGARSVAPREGTDPDAVLSRAEAAVRDGRLIDALAELDTLPENSQSAMDVWLADARARQAAESAAEDLSQRLTAN